MKILVFDVETTWFINKKEPDLSKQPHIVQFAWIMWEIKDNKFFETKRINQLIKPPIPIPFSASKVHHIYDVDVQKSPSINEKIDEFLDMINGVDVIVWHNIEYDQDMINLELKRLWIEYKYKPKQIFCTMKSTVDFCQIKWNWERFKYPRLWELYRKLFWEFFIWAHDAMVDVEATLKVFLELKNNWIIDVKKPKEEVMSLF